LWTSLYNDRDLFEKNDHNVYYVSSVMGMQNNDGSMTVHLGGAEDVLEVLYPLLLRHGTA
jgi:hypothetical protein